MEDTNRRRRRAISSSLGEVNFGQNRPVLQVDDPTEESQLPPEIVQRRSFSSTEPIVSAQALNEVEQQLKQARTEQAQLKQRASKQAINRLELLTGIGRLVSEVTIDNVKFGLRSLKSKEVRHVMEVAAKEGKTNVGEALLIRNYTLSYSIYQIDGNPIYTIIGSDDILDKMDMVDDFEEGTTEKLWNAYSRMINDSSKNIEKDLGSTPEEIIDTVKKS